MIAIYLNTRIWGGVDVLAGRLASHLRDAGIDFVVVEPPGSRFRKDLEWVRFVDPSDVSSVAGRVTHVIVPSLAKIRDPMFPWKAFGSARFLAWVVHPNDAFRTFFPFSGRFMDGIGARGAAVLKAAFRDHERVLADLLRSIAGRGGAVLMDGATARAFEYFHPSVGQTFPLVPIPSPLSPTVERIDGGEHLSVGYLGRIDSMKWSALAPFVTGPLSELARRRPVALHLVAEGDRTAQLVGLCERHHLTVVQHGYLPNETARQLLCRSTDVVVAMGTAALDIAGSGHPCVIIDPALGWIAPPQKRFRFVHETADYTVGEYRDAPNYVPGQRTFREAIAPATLARAGAAGRAHVAAHHDPPRCFDSLLARLRTSEVRISRLATDAELFEQSFARVKRSPLRALTSRVRA